MLQLLPDDLLAAILVSNTATQEAKIWRLICRRLRDAVDRTMVCAVINDKPDCPANIIETWLQHMQQANLSMLCVYDVLRDCHADRLLNHLPHSLSAILLYGITITSLQPLGSLPQLKTLALEGSGGPLSGLQFVTGLTCLETDRDVGSIAHLAPTLRHLQLWQFSNVQHISQLTNLHALLMVGLGLPRTSLQALQTTPIQHLQWWPQPHTDDLQLNDKEAWGCVPHTLTSLSLWGDYVQAAADVLPDTVTHLQLMSTAAYDIRQATTALSCLRVLDISWRQPYTAADIQALDGISLLADLQLLRLCIPECFTPLPADGNMIGVNKQFVTNEVYDYISHSHILLSAVASNVDVQIVRCISEISMYKHDWPVCSSWHWPGKPNLNPSCGNGRLGCLAADVSGQMKNLHHAAWDAYGLPVPATCVF